MVKSKSFDMELATNNTFTNYITNEQPWLGNPNFFGKFLLKLVYSLRVLIWNEHFTLLIWLNNDYDW